MRPVPIARHWARGAPLASCNKVGACAAGVRGRRLISGSSSSAVAISTGASVLPMPRRVLLSAGAATLGRAMGARSAPPIPKPSARHCARVAPSIGPLGRRTNPSPSRAAPSKTPRCAAQLRSSTMARSNRRSVAPLMAMAGSPSAMPPPALICVVTAKPASVAQRRRYLTSGPGAAARISRRGAALSVTSSGTAACSTTRCPSRTRRVKAVVPAARAVPVRVKWPSASGVALSVTRPAGSSRSMVARGRAVSWPPTRNASPGATLRGGAIWLMPGRGGGGVKRTATARAASRSRAAKPSPSTVMVPTAG